MKEIEAERKALLDAVEARYHKQLSAARSIGQSDGALYSRNQERKIIRGMSDDQLLVSRKARDANAKQKPITGMAP